MSKRFTKVWKWHQRIAVVLNARHSFIPKMALRNSKHISYTSLSWNSSRDVNIAAHVVDFIWYPRPTKLIHCGVRVKVIDEGWLKWRGEITSLNLLIIVQPNNLWNTGHNPHPTPFFFKIVGSFGLGVYVCVEEVCVEEVCVCGVRGWERDSRLNEYKNGPVILCLYVSVLLSVCVCVCVCGGWVGIGWICYM